MARTGTSRGFAGCAEGAAEPSAVAAAGNVGVAAAATAPAGGRWWAAA